ncbi:uncharacterized protein LOC110976758 [Acanthaster planci]|uniref:Uncharacterized protein LOC110976758 n=1 Tax=Acanthaster planci TaxID=133434 RepID=A0A8B7XYN2_ACAPL|nr:uncharacterized protein LOC110976758 [Acanthaster planci]XP_022086014.1 uncharacterized protein LOC110976758 [Acanthaster planci]
MSSNNKENVQNDKKKKSKPRLSIKIFSSNSKKKDSLKKIREELHSPDGSYKPHLEDKQVETPAKEVKDVEVVATEETDSDTSEETIPVSAPPPAFRPGRRRSLSACADVQDTLIKIKGKDEEDNREEKIEEEEEQDDQLSPLPLSPTKSCLRTRSATFGYAGEIIVTASRPRTVSFSPETVDPPPRTQKYRAWIEARSKPPPVNVKHEKHKQKMNQLKKVNMADYLSSRKPTSGSGIMGSSSAAFGGGMMM